MRALFRPQRSEPALSESLEPLWQRLAETIAWAEPRADARCPRDCLRSESARPRVLESDYFAAVSSACLLRRSRAADVPRRTLAGGRLLVYFPDLDLADGAAEAESGGFFDVNNCPPWDSWVALVSDGPQGSPDPYLLAWVPPSLLELAGKGIAVNPEECIAWLEDAEVQARSILGAIVATQ